MLPQLLPPVLSAFSDPDARVRYTACEALYNIAKVARSSCVAHVNAIFDGLFKLSADTDVQVGRGTISAHRPHGPWPRQTTPSFHPCGSLDCLFSSCRFHFLSCRPITGCSGCLAL